jgi:hypothetical protein
MIEAEDLRVQKRGISGSYQVNQVAFNGSSLFVLSFHDMCKHQNEPKGS